jgi:hypothetical protein
LGNVQGGLLPDRALAAIDLATQQATWVAAASPRSTVTLPGALPTSSLRIDIIDMCPTVQA